MSGTLLAVDANNLAMRAIHAVRYRRPPETAQDAMVHAAGAVDRFWSMFGRLMAAEAPERVVLVWDCVGPSWRAQPYPEYKATRKSQVDPDAQHSAFALVKEIAYLIGIPNVAAPQMEADDLIGAFWRGAEPTRVGKFVIVSSDRDFAQLVGVTARGIPCEQVPPSGADGDRLTREGVQAKWGCAPHQIPLVKALMGDDGDNIVGIHGIGPKKAVKNLIAANWSLDRALEPYEVTDRERVTMNVGLVNLREGEFSIPSPARFFWPSSDNALLRDAAVRLRMLGLDRLASQVLSGELVAPRQDGAHGTSLDVSELL